MSDRRIGYIVYLDEDVPEDRIEAIAAALAMIKGVASVQAPEGDPDSLVARDRINAEWRQRIVGLLDDEGV